MVLKQLNCFKEALQLVKHMLMDYQLLSITAFQSIAIWSFAIGHAINNVRCPCSVMIGNNESVLIGQEPQ